MVQKTKLVFAVNDFLIGGAQKLHLDLFNFLNKEKFEIHLITLFQFPGKKDFLTLVPSYVTVHQMDFRNSRDVKQWWRLFMKLENLSPDIVITSLFLSNTIFRILRVFFDYQVIATEHNTYINKTNVQKITDRILSFITFKIIAVSQTVAKFTSNQEHIPLEKFVVIQNGIDIQKINTEIDKATNLGAVRESIGIKPNQKVLLNVARLTHQKNQKLLIDAFNVFSKKHDNFVLVIVGEGALRYQLQNQIDTLGLEGKVFLLGAKTDITSYYLMSDIFISTSDIEGFGIAHAEALACGLPLVSTKTAGPDEMIIEGTNGFFAESNPESVAKGIEKLEDSDIRAGDPKIAASVEKFSIKETVRKYEALVESALEHKKRNEHKA